MTNNIVIISDLHCGCGLALCPSGVRLDNGNTTTQSSLQEKLWTMWLHYWNDWIPKVTRGEKYVVVNNGDSIDGVHHGTVTQITHNITDQIRMAEEALKPIVANTNCVGYYHIRGTEAHVGKSGQAEEGLAKTLKAIPDEIGNHARWEMWMRMNGSLIHFSHHVSGTNATTYEGTGLHKEMVEAFVDAGRWKNQPPDCIVRSHRHRQFETRVATANGYGIALITPGWQLKTPHVHRLLLGRNSMPQIGGYVIRHGDEDSLYTRFKVWNIERPQEVTI